MASAPNVNPKTIVSLHKSVSKGNAWINALELDVVLATVVSLATVSWINRCAGAILTVVLDFNA